MESIVAEAREERDCKDNRDRRNRKTTDQLFLNVPAALLSLQSLFFSILPADPPRHSAPMTIDSQAAEDLRVRAGQHPLVRAERNSRSIASFVCHRQASQDPALAS